MNSGCVYLSQELANLLPTTISTSVLLKLLFNLDLSFLFHVISILLLLQVSPAYCYMPSGWFPTVVAPIHVSISSTLLRLRNLCFTFMLFNFLQCFDDHVMLSCYLHLSLRLRPKPLHEIKTTIPE